MINILYKDNHKNVKLTYAVTFIFDQNKFDVLLTQAHILYFLQLGSEDLHILERRVHDLCEVDGRHHILPRPVSES